MSLQSVKRLQLDQAADLLVTCRSYSCLGLDGGLGEGKLVPPSPLLYLLFTNLHFDAYCYSCDTVWCWVYMTSVWLCSKMHNKLCTPSFCDSGCLCALQACVYIQHFKHMGLLLRISNNSTKLSQLSVSNIFLYFFHLLADSKINWWYLKGFIDVERCRFHQITMRWKQLVLISNEGTVFITCSYNCQWVSFM